MGLTPLYAPWFVKQLNCRQKMVPGDAKGGGGVSIFFFLCALLVVLSGDMSSQEPRGKSAIP